MNEIQALQDLLAKPPATQAVRDEGRHRLQRLMRGKPAPSWSRTLWPVGALGVTAAAAAGLIVLVGTGSPAVHNAAPNSPPPAPAPMSANEVLLSAATTVGGQPSTGRYWRISTSGSLGSFDTGRGYKIEQRMKRTLWLSGSPSGTSWAVTQFLGYRPQTPADVAAWKADGSPTSWKLPMCRLKKCPDNAFSNTDQPVSAERLGKAGVVGSLGNYPITLAQIRKLPSDPAKLKAEIARRLPGAHGTFLDTVTFEDGIELIMELPVSSPVRAAAYRMMAALPGVRALGEFTDPLGRKGQAITMGADGSTKTKHRLIIDPATGMPLTWEQYQTRNGQVVMDDTVSVAGWTNSHPDLQHP